VNLALKLNGWSRSECVERRVQTLTGKPDPKHVSAGYTERADLTMRMPRRRFTRLTNAFSKQP